MILISAPPISTDIPIIKSEYRVLLFDQEPILYSGKNRYGTMLVGSSVDEDYTTRIHRQFRIPVSKADFVRFVHQEVAYYDLLKSAGSVYLIESDFGGTQAQTFLLPFGQIPEDYLPEEDALCPVQEITPSANLFTKLKGKLADTHRVLASDLTRAQNAIEGLIESILEPVREVSQGRVRLLVDTDYRRSSFGISYQVEFDQHGSLFHDPESQILLVNKLVEYTTTAKEEDIKSIGTEAVTERAKPIEKAYMQVYSTQYPGEEETGKKNLKRALLNALAHRSDLRASIGASFTSVEIHSGDEPEDDSHILGVIDSTTKNSLVEINTEPEKTEVNGKWEIYIYQLSTRSGFGRADLSIERDGDKRLYKGVPFQVKGFKTSLANSKYSEAHHTSRAIELDGTMLFENGEPRKLTIPYESKEEF